MKKIIAICLSFTLLVAATAYTQENWPESGWQNRADPIASPDAYEGGQFRIFLAQYPKSLNYYLDLSTQSAQIFSLLFETLLTRNPLTLAYEPGLAARWSIAADKKTFTFHLDPRARWSDGTPLTAHDVKWTYDTIMDPKNLTGPFKVDLERFLPPVVLDDHTLRLVAKTVHWKNLLAASSFHVLSRNAYGNQDFNKVNFTFPVVSGPYRMGEIREGIYVDLKRRADWWQRQDARTQGLANFESLRFRFFAERENAFEAFKKGQIDYFPVYTARLWVNETKDKKFQRNWIVKQKVFNRAPVGFQGFAMNMRKSPFDDVRVRKAMAYLLDRRKMNASLMYSQYFLHRSYYEDLYSKDNPCPNELIEKDPPKARILLREAGWKANPGTGFLEKNGRRFSFKFLTRSASSAKFLAIYAEDLKDAGIELVIDQKDWAAWARDMDQFNFQMTWAAWGADVFKDPEGMWSSKEADRQGGSNITGFKNPEVDTLIEQQRTIFDVNRRNALYRRIDRIVYNTFPYVLLWNLDYTRLLYWNTFGTPDTVLSKFDTEQSAYRYWWFDEDSAADLEEAIQSEDLLPAKEPVVSFEDFLP